MPASPWNASWHLRAELTRILDGLARQLERQRQRGRTPAGDAVRGMVIEEGETEGLVSELAAELSRGEREVRQAESPRRLRQEIAERADAGVAQGTFLPLRHAQKVFDLTPEEYDALILAVAVEVEARFGRIVAYLNDHVGRTRPTVGLALALAAADAERGPHRWPLGLEDRPVFRDGLLELEGEGPFPGLAFRLSKGVLPRLCASSKEATADEAAFQQAWWSVHACDQDLLSRLAEARDAPRCLPRVWGRSVSLAPEEKMSAHQATDASHTELRSQPPLRASRLLAEIAEIQCVAFDQAVGSLTGNPEQRRGTGDITLRSA